MIKLIRYWFEFDYNSYTDLPMGLALGCGVTAYNYDDALVLLSQEVSKGRPVAKIKKVVENVDVSTLDPGHVLLNLGAPPSVRGVWWPAGYA